MTLPWLVRLTSDSLQQPVFERQQYSRIMGDSIQAEQHHKQARLVITGHQMQKGIAVARFGREFVVNELVGLQSFDILYSFTGWHGCSRRIFDLDQQGAFCL